MAENIYENEAVVMLQTYLRALSFEDRDMGDVPLDGIWDSATRDALTVFQKNQGLAPSGRVDRETWERLRNEYERTVALNSPPAMIDVFPRSPTGFRIRMGDRGFIVDAIHYLLGELERLYDFPDVSLGDTFGEESAALIRIFQSRNGIDVSGEVDRETWDALAVQHNLLDRYNE